MAKDSKADNHSGHDHPAGYDKEADLSRNSEPDQTATAAQQPSPPASPEAPASDRARPRRLLPLLLLLILMVLLGLLAAGGWFGWQQWQQLSQQQARLNEQLAGNQQQWQQAAEQLRARQQQQALLSRQWQQSLEGVEQRLEQQSQRLRNLSTTTRADWQLAEAEYLLRLASQRLLTARDSRGALALLQAVDRILAGLDDDQLFPVRDRLNRDIAALKLTPTIDRNGRYLQLAALIEQIEQLPQVPLLEELSEPEAATAVVPEPAVDESVWQTLKRRFLQAMGSLRDQVRIRHHDQPLEPLLPPDGAQYLRQNLRFHLELAQLAMLRAEPDIYRHSLGEAVTLLRRYFSTQPAARIIAGELQSLAGQPVIVDLPDIQGSLTALQDHIARLHQLDESAGRPQVPAEEAQVP